MNRVVRFAVTMLGAAYFFLPANVAWALTPEQVISLKNAGVSDQTIQLMIRQEQEAAAGAPEDSPARKEIRDKDGKAVIIYSTGRSAGDSRDKEERQTEKAWEMLRTIIIDDRRHKR